MVARFRPHLLTKLSLQVFSVFWRLDALIQVKNDDSIKKHSFFGVSWSSILNKRGCKSHLQYKIWGRLKMAYKPCAYLACLLLHTDSNTYPACSTNWFLRTFQRVASCVFWESMAYRLACVCARIERSLSIYMVKDFFVEVLYQHDNSEGEAEKLNVFDSLKGLNSYLEKEFKTAFW